MIRLAFEPPEEFERLNLILLFTKRNSPMKHVKSLLLLFTAVSLLFGGDRVYTLPYITVGGSKLSGPQIRGGANFHVGDALSLVPFASLGLHDVGVGTGIMFGGSKGTSMPIALMASGTLFTNYLETNHTKKIDYNVRQQGVHVQGTLLFLLFYIDVGRTYTFDDDNDFFNWGMGIALY